MFKFYEVGGCVRDEVMGVKSKDIDYTVVYKRELFDEQNKPTADEAFPLMEKYLTEQGYHIWLSTPNCFTIRAKFPEGHKNTGMTADFVLARKELGYIPGTRKPFVTIGTLYDDLERRDFTVNAIAKDEHGRYIDPFNGLIDIINKTLRTPLDVYKTFDDDPLRILRAIRFSVTKLFTIPSEMWDCIQNYDYYEKMGVVSEERIREELYKCFKNNSLLTIVTLWNAPHLMEYIFNKTKLWLCPTNKE